jgi:signal transduction histidine kinase
MDVVGSISGRTGRREPVLVEALHRGLDLLRPLAAAYAGWLVWQRRDTMVRPLVAFAVLALMATWSLGLLWYRRRTRRVIATEMVIAVIGILATLLAETPEAIVAGQFTIPTVWAAAPVVGAAVLSGARGGLVVAGIIAIADLLEIGRPNQTTVHNIVILILLGGLIGLAVDLARQGQAREEQVLLERERLDERERLARVVHDGVLQSLAYIHRRGADIGGVTAELSTLAAEQERALRRFVSGIGAPGAAASADLRGVPGAEVDLRQVLTARERPGVSVSVPAMALVVDRQVADEVGAALDATLDNVARHAGPRARAWVLLEGGLHGVEVTVRDDGVGTTPERLTEAAATGRLGVRSSIRGRVEDLGGSATWTVRPGGGCTVRLTIPRHPPERR